MRRALTLPLLLALALPAFATGYSYQSTITLGSATYIPATEANFTMLVCANMTLGNGHACPTVANLTTSAYVSSSSGYDIVFSTTACTSPTLMSWEMVSYNGSTGAMEAWVQNTSLAANGVFYMCVGNAGISSFQGGATGAAWSASYMAVWHLPNGSTLTLSDSTSNGNSLSNGGYFSAATGQIDGGATSSSSIAYLDTANTPAGPSAITVSAWVNPWADGYNDALISQYASTSSFGSNNFLLTEGASGAPTWTIYSGSSAYSVTSSQTMTTDGSTWYYIAATFNGSVTAIYVNGVLSSAGHSVAINTNSLSVYLGDPQADVGSTNGCECTMDEVHMENTVRNSNWVLAEYNNQSVPSSFMSIAALATPGSARGRIIVVD